MNKVSLGKKIFQFKSATDEDIRNYCELIGIEIPIETIRIISSMCNFKYSKFLEHYKKYGNSVTIDKFLSKPNTTNSKIIAEHYGVVTTPKKRNNVYDPKYISKRENISLEEAEKYIEEYKDKKSTSKNNFIKKYGKVEGEKRYESWYNSTLKKGNNLTGGFKSKFSKEYYLKRGFSDSESIEMALKYQYENSPLHIEYYIKRNKTFEYARKAIRKIHDKKIGKDYYRILLESQGYDNDEIDIIIKEKRTTLCREKMGEKRFEQAISKMRKTFEAKGLWVPLDDMSDYMKYKKEVIRYTNMNNISEMENADKRGLAGSEGSYHLDHKFSIQQGYINKVPPEVIGSSSNLIFIPWEENVSKQAKCSIDLEELYENQKN